MHEKVTKFTNRNEKCKFLQIVFLEIFKTSLKVSESFLDISVDVPTQIDIIVFRNGKNCIPCITKYNTVLLRGEISYKRIIRTQSLILIVGLTITL